MTQQEYMTLGDLPPFEKRDAISRATELKNLAHILRRKPFPQDCPLDKVKNLVVEIDNLAEWMLTKDGAIWDTEVNRVYNTALKAKSIQLETDTIRNYVSIVPLSVKEKESEEN